MNKFMWQLAAVFFVSSANCVVHAQAATPVYQVSDVKGTFIQVPLTHEIYRYARHSDLHDLKVLDADNNSLPYQLVVVSPKTEKAESKLITDKLAFFPVAVDATPDTLRKLHTTQTKVQGDKVQIAASDRVLDNKTPEFYLIDISKVDHAITSLNVDWEAQAENQYLEIELEATRNLQDWISLGRATLVKLDQQGQQLKHNDIKIDVDKKQYEFLRLKIVRGAEQLNIISVNAQQEIHSIDEVKLASETWNVSGQPAKVQTSVHIANSRSKTQQVAAWEFSRTDVTPVEALSLDLGSHIYGDSIKIFSRNAENKEWQLSHQGIWFNAQVGDKWQTSESISVYHNNHKFWRVELAESAKNYNPPTLVFSWRPIELQIIANNKPPFFLAISNESGANNNNQQVFNQIVSAASPKWVAANLIKLNVQPESIMAPTQPVDWKQWIFWAALVAAVVVLLIFSLKLFKQLNASQIQQ